MSEFMVRVEIHGGTREDYDKLHEKLLQHGFYRAVQGTDNSGQSVKLALPTGTYWYHGPSTDGSVIAKFVSDTAKVIRPTQPPPYVFVGGIGGSEMTWWGNGLPPA